jgi:hypothetical protein
MVSSIKENNMQLLQDVFIMENLQVLEEGAGSKKMKIRGTFQRAEEANNNGRIYPTKVLEGQVSQLQPLIEERRLCGELDHPQNDTVKLSNASHLVTRLDMKNGEVIGEAEILKTPAGLTAQALINGGVKIGISSRGMGTLSENSDGAKIVNEDFKLVTFDLVADPSTRGAFPGLSESRESSFVKTTQGKLEKESNFITMLESKMRDAYQPWIDEAMAGKGDTAAARKKDRGDANARRIARRSDLMKRAKASTTMDTNAKRRHMKDIGSGRFDDAFELIKADGHWHRIAEAIAVAMGHNINETLSALEGDGDKTITHKEKKDREGIIGRALRQRSERKHAEKSAKGMAIAKAKGEAAGSKIAGKARRGEEMKDVTAKGKQSRERVKQSTKTHGKREKSKSAKARQTQAGKEQRAFDKQASPMKRGTSHTTRAVHGAARDAAEGAVEKTGKAMEKGSFLAGKALGKAGRFLKARANSAKKPPIRSGK